MRLRPSQLLLPCVSLYLAALVVVGCLVHPIPVAGGEYDGYAERAELLLAGNLVNDPFHGMLYPELVALVSTVVGDAFAAARLVTSLSAAVLLLALHRLTTVTFGARPAWWTTVLLMANAPFAVMGVQAIADVLGAALLVGALAVAAGGESALRRGVVGLLLGLAISARPSFLPLAAVFVVWVVWCGERGVVARLLRCGPLLAGVVIGYLPHAIPTTLQFGSPLANQSWRILASKAAGWDTTPLHAPEQTGLFELLREHGGTLWRLGCADFATLWCDTMPTWLLGGAPWSPGTVVMAVAGIVAGVWFARQRGHLTWLVSGVVVVYAALVAFTFQPTERTLLAVAPCVLAWSVAMVDAWTVRGRLVGTLVGVVVLTCTMAAAPAVWVGFVGKHPTAEIVAARELLARHGASVVVASFYPMLGRLAGVQALTLSVTSREPQALWAGILAAARPRGVDYVVTSTASIGPLGPLVAALPAGARVERHEGELLVVALDRDTVTWLAEADAALSADGRRFELVVRTLPSVPLVAAGFTVFPPQGNGVLVPLVRVGEHEFRGTVGVPNGAAGPWRFVPGCMLGDGQLRGSAAIQRDVR